MNLQFENDREALRAVCSSPAWIESSGEAPGELLSSCLQIEAECTKSNCTPLETKTKMLCYILDHGQIAAHPLDLFPDRLQHDTILYRIRDRWIRKLRKEQMQPLLAENADAQKGLCYTGNLDLGHTAPDWNAILRLGIPGLLMRVENARKREGLTAEQIRFHVCVSETLSAFLRLTERLSFAARQSGGPYAKEVADSLDRLTAGAPDTLLSAMQLIMIWYNLQTNVESEPVRSLGGLDRLLYPLYKNDLQSGRITKEEAKEYFRYFFWKLYSMKVTANVPFYICGRKADGSDATNELTELIVDTYVELDIDDPKIHVLWHTEIDDALSRKILAAIRGNKSSFVLINNDTVEKALIGIGEDPADARNYTIIGCYEPCALGHEIPCTVAGRVNLPKAILTVMAGGTDFYTGAKVGAVCENADSYKTFDEFYAAVKTQVGFFCDRTMDLIRGYEAHYPKVSQAPLLSASFADCIERGRDCYDGGVKYNNSSICAISVASATDALIAIRELVYNEKKLTLSEFARILENNWAGAEELRESVLSKYPKYGNGNADADALAADLIGFATDRINGQPNGRGGVFRTGLFSIDWRITFGERTGATADGRRAGEMLSKNMGAVTAMDKQGVTATVLSATVFDYTAVPDGTVLDVMFHESAVEGEDGIEAMLSIVKVYMARGGFAIQMNVFSPEVLRAAQAEPEKYATLQVRLCGWNVYFVELTKAEQDELIRQSENTVNA